MIDWTLNKSRALRFRYTNWRGETAMRMVTPVQIWFGETEYHTDPQWLMDGLDHDKGAARTFALKDCDFTDEEGIS